VKQSHIDVIGGYVAYCVLSVCDLRNSGGLAEGLSLIFRSKF